MLSHYIQAQSHHESMSHGSLIFTPGPGEPPPLPPLIERLRGIGFLGAPLEQGGFLVGERFMQLVSFMGCSPFLQLEPPADGSDRFCRILFDGPLPRPRVHPDRSGRPPRCPHCRGAVSEWRERFKGEGEIACRHCGGVQTLDSLDWGRYAGAGRLFMEVREIYPGDGTPSDTLLACLQDAGTGWHWFWHGGGSPSAIDRL